MKDRELPAGVVIVTGATGGIGRALVESLAERGTSHIIMACRNVARAHAIIDSLQPSTTSRLTAMSLELDSLDSVDDFAARIKAMNEPVAALINNAGTMPAKAVMTRDGMESATQVNYYATRRLTEKLLPVVADGGAIVFTTSMTRRIARLHTDWPRRAITHHSRFITYGRSKLMVARFALQLSQRLAPRHIRVNCSDPGIVDSAIITMGNRFIDALSDRFFRPLISTTQQGAEAALRALDARSTGYIFTRRNSSPVPPRLLARRQRKVSR